MSGTPPNLQDTFLNKVRAQKIPVSIFLTNGVQLKGNVSGFDRFTVILETNGRHQLIFKHGITTVFPSRPVKGLLEEAFSNGTLTAGLPEEG